MSHSASEVAVMIGTDPKTLRRFLRSNASYRNVGSGARYSFEDADIKPLEKSFKAWNGTRRSKNTFGTPVPKSKDTRAAAHARVDALEKSLKERNVHINQHVIMTDEMMISDSEPTGHDLVELCEVCGEPCDNETGMFYDPEEPALVYVTHADCGLSKGWKIA